MEIVREKVSICYYGKAGRRWDQGKKVRKGKKCHVQLVTF